MLALERDDSAVLPGIFRLALSRPEDREPVIRDINGPCTLIGRREGATCHIDDPGVSPRHAYLQSLFGRMYCFDLGGGTFSGQKHPKGGWFNIGAEIGVGPYRIRLLDMIGLGGGAERLPDHFNPLDHYAGQVGPLPKIDLEFITGEASTSGLTISRMVTLLGSTSRCKIRLEDKSVSTVHCSLVWLRDGLWIVDLAGKGGTRVRGKSVRCAHLVDGQKIRVGQFLMRVHISGKMVHSATPDANSSNPAGSASRWHITRSAEGRPTSEKAKTHREVGNKPPQSPVGEIPLAGIQVTSDQRQIGVDRAGFDAQEKAIEARERQLEAREAKQKEARERLAAEWDQLHADRALLTTLNEGLTRKQEELAGQARALAEEAAAIARQRQELYSWAADLTEMRHRTAAEWQLIEAERLKLAELQLQLAAQRDELARLEREFNRRGAELGLPDASSWPGGGRGASVRTKDSANEVSTLADPDEILVSAPAELADPADHDFDCLEATRHNKVFRTERLGTTLIVVPLGDASEFHYGDVHTEANKVRRLLDSGAFENLVVDLADAPLFSAVMINVIVSLSRIAANRGGRAALCNASDKTRGLLQSMKLLEVWPLFADREQALHLFTQPGKP